MRNQAGSGTDEAVAFIAGSVAELTGLAPRLKLEILHHLLEMVQLEAEERLRYRSKRKLPDGRSLRELPDWP
jgi:hypothetical protein